MSGWKQLRRHFDWLVFTSIVALGLVGMLNLYSATSASRLSLMWQQALWFGCGLLALLGVASLDYRWLGQIAYPLYGAGVAALGVVLVLGRNVNQSRRWIDFRLFAMQPSETMKLLLILALAKYLHDDPFAKDRRWRRIATPILLVGVPFLLVARQPDLGTATLIFLLFLSIILVTKLRLRSTVLLLVLALAALPIGWRYLLHDYQRSRIRIFLDPSQDPAGSGWQARQSLFAVGSGGIAGRGFMKGTQNQLNFLPERWTDFPFAVWAEEWGFIGSALLLSVYLMLILAALRLAKEARDRFGIVLCVGVAALFFWHVVINIGMVMGVFPVVGVTLPLVSYGGSSMLTMMAAAGLLMNVSARRTAF